MALTAYSVTPRRQASSRGPKPSEKRSTVTPDHLATAKCPSSCTKINRPRIRIAIRMLLPMRVVLLSASVTEEEPGVIVDERRRENETINAIEHSAVPRDDPTGVLRAESALQHGLAEVADLRETSDRETQAQDLRPRERRKEH